MFAGGVWEILTGTPEDHGFTRPASTREIPGAVVEQVLLVLLSLSSLWTPLRELRASWRRTSADCGLSVANTAPAAVDCETPAAGHPHERGARGGPHR